MNGFRHLVDRGLVRTDVPLAPLTTYKLGGPAAWYAEPHTEAELTEVLTAAVDVDVLAIGRGSNLVVSDAGFKGLVVRLVGDFTCIELDDAAPSAGAEDDDVVTVRAGAAVGLPQLARATVRAGFGGLEFMVGVPGSVGGAVAMNAGCFGSETADWLIAATLIDVRDGSTRIATPADLEMGYRHTTVASTDLVTSAVFRLAESDPAAGEIRMREITRWRRDNQPGGTLNAGSVFKNPPDDAAGRIIDDLGLRGHRVGGVSVSERHANFFVASQGATSQDIHDLVMDIQRRVAEGTGVTLQPEIRFVGRFTASSADEEASP